MTTMPQCFIIAEAGVNHNGDEELAYGLVDAAAEAGADAVKFQTFKAENLVTATADRADYQKRNTASSESQYEMLKQLELSEETQRSLKDYCQQKGITFLSSPFDLESLYFLVEDLRVDMLKLASGEITNGPLLLAAARSDLPLILSTGMSTIEDIERALSVIAFGLSQPSGNPSKDDLNQDWRHRGMRERLQQKVTLLHCTTEYPASPLSVNLRAMATMTDHFELPVGYSDHTQGIHISSAAAALGARIIEKHFTLDRDLPGPDHKASLVPTELRDLVNAVREISQALGDGKKVPVESELGNLKVVRKSLVAAAPIGKGESFTASNLACKRPGTGRSPMEYWSLLGDRATRDYRKDELI